MATYSGVRPLIDDESDSPEAVTRDYTFEVNESKDQASLLSVFGGKITTHRKLSERWTADAGLLGGDFETHHELQTRIARQHTYLPHSLVKLFVRTYGTLTIKLLKDVK